MRGPRRRPSFALDGQPGLLEPGRLVGEHRGGGGGGGSGRENRPCPGGPSSGRKLGDREIALAGVVVEAEDALAGADLVELLADRVERRARADADQHAFLAGGAAAISLASAGSTWIDAVEAAGVHDRRDEAGADALDRVRAGLAARQDRRQGRLDREHLEARPFRLEDLGAGGDVAAGADAGDQQVDRRVAEIGEDLLGGGAAVDLEVGRILELLRHPAVGVSASSSWARSIAPFMPFSRA